MRILVLSLFLVVFSLNLVGCGAPANTQNGAAINGSNNLAGNTANKGSQNSTGAEKKDYPSGICDDPAVKRVGPQDTKGQAVATLPPGVKELFNKVSENGDRYVTGTDVYEVPRV